MKIHELTIAKLRNPKRVGRGISAGQGKTAGRGTKGQKARTGGGVRPGFEGGQNPLAKRLPKMRGFKPLQGVDVQAINLTQLSQWPAKDTVTGTSLAATGLVRSAFAPVKILSNGEITAKLKFEVQAVSAVAKTKIEKAGGSVKLVPVAKRHTTENSAKPKAGETPAETAKTTEPSPTN